MNLVQPLYNTHTHAHSIPPRMCSNIPEPHWQWCCWHRPLWGLKAFGVAEWAPAGHKYPRTHEGCAIISPPYSSAFACTCIRADEQTALIGSIVNASWLLHVYICVRVYTCGCRCMYAFVCRAFHVLQLSAQQSISRDKYSEQRNVYGKQKHVRCAQTNVNAARFC